MNKGKYNGVITNGDIRRYSINMLDFSGVTILAHQQVPEAAT